MRCSGEVHHGGTEVHGACATTLDRSISTAKNISNPTKSRKHEDRCSRPNIVSRRNQVRCTQGHVREVPSTNNRSSVSPCLRGASPFVVRVGFAPKTSPGSRRVRQHDRHHHRQSFEAPPPSAQFSQRRDTDTRIGLGPLRPPISHRFVILAKTKHAQLNKLCPVSVFP
jgi:hypothetical protein